MRLEPIERPTTIMGKFAYFASKRQMGKVITPLKVVYARVPKSLKMAYGVSKFVEGGLSLDPELQFLIQTHVAGINDCAFCVDIAKAFAVNSRMGIEKVHGLSNFETDERFTEGERAALAYVEEATRSKKVSDNTFARLKKEFSDSEIAEITMLNAIENYFNLINVPLEIESDGLCVVAPVEVSGVRAGAAHRG